MFKNCLIIYDNGKKKIIYIYYLFINYLKMSDSESSENSLSKEEEKEANEEEEKENKKEVKTILKEENNTEEKENEKEVKTISKEEIKEEETEEKKEEIEETKLEIINHKLYDINKKEYLLTLKSSINSIDISCVQVDDENNIYLSNILFSDVKKKHKYLKGAETIEELIEALNEFIDTTKITFYENKPNYMKITFIITYLKKTDSISFDLNKKIIKVEEEEESFKGDGTISTIDKQMKKIALNHINLNKKISNIIKMNENLMKEYEESNKKIDDIENNIQILNQNLENLTNLINKQEESNIINEVNNNNPIYNNFNQKDLIEEYNEEKIITSKNYNYTFIQLTNGLILIGYKSGLIKVYEPLSYKLLIEVSVHKKNINCLLELSSGYIASCSLDKYLVITKLNYDNKTYEEIQRLGKNSSIFKIIEINGSFLLSSDCENIDVWRKNNMGKYDYFRNIKIGKNIYGILQVNLKYFVAHIGLRTLQFYNIDNFSLVKEIKEIPTRLYNNLEMINDDILCIGSTEKLFLISVSKMEIINVANIDNCGIESLILLPDKTLLAGVTYPIDNFPSYNFIQFKLNENINLEIVSTKKMVHSWTIYDLKNINIYGINKIASCGSMDCSIKIWS